MLRLLIVTDHTSEAAEMVARARRGGDLLGDDVEMVVVASEPALLRRRYRRAVRGLRLVAVAPGLPTRERLEVGLLLRPLPEQLILVGRDPSFTATEVCTLSRLLDERRDLGAITIEDARRLEDAVVDRGGAFRPGWLVPAGGFVGDGWRSVADRLADLGSPSVTMPAPDPPLRVSA